LISIVRRGHEGKLFFTEYGSHVIDALYEVIQSPDTSLEKLFLTTIGKLSNAPVKKHLIELCHWVCRLIVRVFVHDRYSSLSLTAKPELCFRANLLLGKTTSEKSRMISQPKRQRTE